MASTLTRYISRNMSRALFEPAPSVPMARAMPSSIKRFTGAIPLASLRFEGRVQNRRQAAVLNIAISSSHVDAVERAAAVFIHAELIKKHCRRYAVALDAA